MRLRPSFRREVAFRKESAKMSARPNEAHLKEGRRKKKEEGRRRNKREKKKKEEELRQRMIRTTIFINQHSHMHAPLN